MLPKGLSGMRIVGAYANLGIWVLHAENWVRSRWAVRRFCGVGYDLDLGDGMLLLAVCFFLGIGLARGLVCVCACVMWTRWDGKGGSAPRELSIRYVQNVSENIKMV